MRYSSCRYIFPSSSTVGAFPPFNATRTYTAFPDPPRRTVCRYRLFAEDHAFQLVTLSVTIDRNLPDASPIDSLGYSCADSAGPQDMRSRLEDIETAPLDLSDTCVPQLRMMCRQQSTAKNVLKSLLDCTTFSRHFSRLRKVSVWIDQAGPPWRELSLDEVLSTLTHLTVEGATISLDTAERVEVLLHDECSGHWQKRLYIRGLLDAGTSALSSSDQLPLQDKDVQGASSMRVEDTMEREEQGDGGGVADGPTQLGRERRDLGNLREDERRVATVECPRLQRVREY